MALVCDVCGRESSHFFLRQVKAEGWVWGVRDVWTCARCVDLGLQIRELLEGEGCLNSMEVCRVLNGVFDPRECVKAQAFGAPRKWSQGCNGHKIGCTIPRLKVYQTLYRLERKGRIQSVKRRFWDRTPMRTDLFRFWFVSWEAYERRVLAQTLEGYT